MDMSSSQGSRGLAVASSLLLGLVVAGGDRRRLSAPQPEPHPVRCAVAGRLRARRGGCCRVPGLRSPRATAAQAHRPVRVRCGRSRGRAVDARSGCVRAELQPAV